MKHLLKNIPGVLPFYKKLYSIWVDFFTPKSQDEITKSVFEYNYDRFRKYSGAFKESKIKDLSYITWLYHVIEKGLAMPNMRTGFGYDKIKILDEELSASLVKYGEMPQIREAVSVLLEYLRIHEEFNFHIDDDIFLIINKWKDKYPDVQPIFQSVSTKEDLYKDVNGNFESFMRSRHSIRNFSGSIKTQQIVDAIELARYAPSACNRQPTRIHIVENKELCNACLSLQSGNRGFGHLADKLLVVTGDLSTILGGQEFFDLGLNVGIFIMNLSYSLHYKKVAHCILNWYALPSEDKQLRKLLKIPNEETVFAFIVCGDVPSEFKIVSSPRLSSSLLYKVHL